MMITTKSKCIIVTIFLQRTPITYKVTRLKLHFWDETRLYPSYFCMQHLFPPENVIYVFLSTPLLHLSPVLRTKHFSESTLSDRTLISEKQEDATLFGYSTVGFKWNNLIIIMILMFYFYYPLVNKNSRVIMAFSAIFIIVWRVIPFLIVLLHTEI